MVVATIPRTTASGLAGLLGVTAKTISVWHRRGVIAGCRTAADKRRVLFRLDDVRRAIDEHALPVDPAVVAMIDETLADV